MQGCCATLCQHVWIEIKRRQHKSQNTYARTLKELIYTPLPPHKADGHPEVCTRESRAPRPKSAGKNTWGEGIFLSCDTTLVQGANVAAMRGDELKVMKGSAPTPWPKHDRRTERHGSLQSVRTNNIEYGWDTMDTPYGERRDRTIQSNL